ncbi:MAG: sugar nucleotide-binding protein [Candidatus Gottesmanbacteria bacterium]|nr:sugar nucleotide-binding protein [Candidatus Gottesmanbacteria bacterium]
MRVVVTGATGYIGSCLTCLASRRGHDVVIASRQRPSTFPASWLPFDLSSDNSIVFPINTNAVVHLAANTTHTNRLKNECELVAAQRLIKSAQEVGAKFIFVSSQTARPDAPTAYGRTKWHIELEVLSAGGWVVRPGQVYGGELRGLFGMLVKTVQQLSILPAFLPAPKVQPIYVDDLAEGLLRIAERGDIPPGVYCLAAPEPISFSKFLDEIAKSRLRCRRGFVPVPVVIIDALATVLGEALRTRLGLERLRSLFDLPVMESASDLKRLGLTLRPLHSGMHPSGNDRRRCLLREGRALLIYVLKEPPGSAVLRRYICAIEQLRGGQALGLPRFFLGYPIFLSLLDKSVWANKTASAEFSWRLDTATMLAEATPTGAYRFLGLGREHGVLSSLFSMTSAVACEVFWRMLRVIFFPLVRLALGRAKGAL